MIAHIEGTVLFRGSRFALIDVGGVGYKLFTSLETLKSIPKKGDKASLFTHLHVRETALELYGFNSMAELELFEMLITISGIGPRSALGVLSVAPLDTLKHAIASGEVAYLTKISGIGKKIAEKIVMELRDKLGGMESVSVSSEDADAIDALVSLGYSLSESREILHKIPNTIGGADERVREALKLLGRHS
ncbi:MAG: Holliday junction branch migration protein RuvA [bacterium]|nr:Holliday junction branch migration protein RuvA [bacterium]